VFADSTSSNRFFFILYIPSVIQSVYIDSISLSVYTDGVTNRIVSVGNDHRNLLTELFRRYSVGFRQISGSGRDCWCWKGRKGLTRNG